MPGRNHLSLYLGEPSRPSKFSCGGCGKWFEVYPPDHIHTVADRWHNYFVTDCVEAHYKCPAQGCGFDNVLYWFSQIPYLRAIQMMPRPTGALYDAGLYNYHPTGATGPSGVEGTGSSQ